MYNFLKTYILKNSKNYISIQEELHRLAELSNEEYQTSEYLKKYIGNLGYEIISSDGPGFIAIADYGNKYNLAFRAEMDGLAIEEHEYNLKYKKRVTSNSEKVSHLCGHDFHMAVLLAVMKILKEKDISLDYNLIFIFESGEEIGSGKFEIIRLLKNYKLLAMWAIHLEPSIDSGKFSVISGPVLAGDVDFILKIKGRAGHASRPDLCSNPLLVASLIVSNIYSYLGSGVNPNKPVTFGIGSINGGETSNSIPDSCIVKGTMRYFDFEEGQKVARNITEIIDFTTKIHGCSYEMENIENNLDPPTINDSKLALIAQNSIKNALSREYLVDIDPLFSSESYHIYSSLCPTLYVLLGTKDLNKGYGADLHNPRFDFDSEIIINAIIATLSFIFEFSNLEEGEK